MMYSISFLSPRYWSMYAMLACLVISATVFAVHNTKTPHAQNMVQICHYTSYDRSVAEVISVDIETLEDHLSHGDSQEVINCPVQCTPRCNDHNACTIDLCDERKNCLPIEERPLLNCDDNSICTFDYCDPEFGCFHATNPNACDDNIACTQDFCDASFDPACTHVPDNSACNDNNPCTIDICDVDVGCRYEPNTCDDNNVCTADSCDPQTGCAHTPTPGSCDDSNACTQVDTCIDGTCVGSSPVPCSPDACNTSACNTQTGLCDLTPKDDGIDCTPLLTSSCVISYQCQSGQCVTTNKTNGTNCNTSCSDTNAEICVDGACIPAKDGNDNPLPFCTDPTYDPCNLNTPFCAEVNGSVLCGLFTGDCGDFNDCTNDSCNINTAMCQHIPITPEDNCDDGLVCTDDAATCDQFAGLVCTHTFNANNSSVCQGPLAPCLAQGNDCNDNDACTLDFCDANTGQCSHVFDLSNNLCISCTSNADCNPSQFTSFLPSCATSWTGTCTNNKCNFVANNNLCPWTNKCQHSPPTCTVTGCSSSVYVSVKTPPNKCYTNTCDPATGIISPVKNSSVCPSPNDCCYAPSKAADGTCYSPCSGVGCLVTSSLCDGNII